MKPLRFFALLSSLVLISPPLAHTGQDAPATNPAAVQNGEDIEFAEPDPVPPPGELRKSFLQQLKEMRDLMHEQLAQASVETKKSPWFAKLAKWEKGMDRVLATRRQDDLFPRIVEMAEIFDRPEGESFPEGLNVGPMQSSSYIFLPTMAQHITEKKGRVNPTHLPAFIRIFTSRGFSGECDWEDGRPVDWAGIMILDAPAVAKLLKAGTWQKADEFLGGTASADDFFESYESEGAGLPVLKAKYAQERKAIRAKFEELRSWVVAGKKADGEE